MKPCRVCMIMFNPIRPMQRVCSPSCAVVDSRNKRVAKAQKVQRKSDRARKVELRTVSDWTKLAQTEFNTFIRNRDLANKEPCISCQRHHDGKWNAGHYRPTSAAPHLRFDERQVNLQCEPCNSNLSGNLILYRVNLIKKIGLEEVEKIEGNNEIKQYRIPELKDLLNKYKAKNKEMRT